MTKLIIHATSLAEWHDLINQAQFAETLELGEDLESYLIFLLMRFTEQPEMAKSVLGVDFLEGMNETGSQRQGALRDVADKCLLFSGLFPASAKRKRVTESYFIELGSSAYLTLADLHVDEIAYLYYELGQRFLVLSKVLQAIRRLGEYDLLGSEINLSESEEVKNSQIINIDLTGLKKMH